MYEAQGLILGISGNTAGVSSPIHGGPLYFQGGANITISQTSNTLVWIGGAGGGGGSVNFSAGTTSQNLTNVVFSNSNGVSFGLNGSTITASVAAAGGAQTGISGIQVSDNTFTSGTVTFRNANGISFGSSGANGISASYTVPSTAGLISAINLSAGTTSNNLSAVTFSNANGVSFGLDGSTVTGSIATSLTNIRVSAGTTSNLLSALTFANANNFSFGLNASTITGSYTVPTVTNSSMTVSDAATSGTLARLAFTNLNGVTLSLSTGAGGSHTIVGSHNALTSQSNQALSGSNGSFTFQTATFGSSNGMHFYTTNGSLVGSYTVPTITNSSWTVSDSATSLTISRLAFTNSNGITMTLSTAAGAATVIASHNGITSQTNQQMTMFATGNTTQSSTGTTNASSLIFRGEGLASIGITGGSVVVSVPAGAPSPVNFSAGASSDNLGSVVFSNSNGVSFGLNGSTITASVNAGGGGGIGAGVSTFGNTAGSTGTITTGNLILVGSGPISLSQSTGAAGSNATITINGPATSSLVGSAPLSVSTNGSTISVYGVPYYTHFNPNDKEEMVAGQHGQATLHVQPITAPAFQFDRAVFPVNFSAATNSTGTYTMSMWLGLYTKNASTLSLMHSSSTTQAITHSGTASSNTVVGPKLFTLGWTTTVSAGNYYMGVISRTTSGGANASISQFLVSQPNSNFSGLFGVVSNDSNQLTLGNGYYTASTTQMPNSIGFSQLNGTASMVRRAPLAYFQSGTV